MLIVNMHQAKTNLSKLVDTASAGEEVIIAKAGKPAAKLVALTAQKPHRKPGAMKGKIKISADFDDALPDDLLDSFEGK